MTRFAVALVHHPVLDREGEVVTTAMTNLDLHDMARSARSYGAAALYIVHPIEAQRALAARIRAHWVDGSGRRRIPDRAVALSIARIVPTLEDAKVDLGGQGAVEVWTTAAAARGRPVLEWSDARARLTCAEGPVLLVLGTGWGLAPSVLDAADVALAPIRGGGLADGYNHLSVRAACAIMLDRLLAPPGDR